jgi:putative membrane protein insertion efficiency factor
MRHLAQRVVLYLLQGYKRYLSPMFPPACRYVPTCSEYAMEAVERYGALRGSLMAAARLLRCHPFAKGGYDPVVRRDVSTITEPCNEIEKRQSTVTGPCNAKEKRQGAVEERRFSAASSAPETLGFSPSGRF